MRRPRWTSLLNHLLYLLLLIHLLLLLLLLMAHHPLHQIRIMIGRSNLTCLILTCELFLRSKIADLERLITILGHLIIPLGNFSLSKLRFYVSWDLSFPRLSSLFVVLFVFMLYLSFIFMVCYVLNLCCFELNDILDDYYDLCVQSYIFMLYSLCAYYIISLFSIIAELFS